jgi:hypothetical protein
MTQLDPIRVNGQAPTQTTVNNKVSRTQIHIYGCLLVALFMGISLGLAPYCGRNPRLTQIRSIQNGARADLQMIFEKETKFHAQFGTYTTDLNAMGVAPKIALYKLGFVRAAESLPEIKSPDFIHRPELKDYDALKAAIPNLEIAFSPVTKLSEISLSALENICADCTANQSRFRAIAAANLDADSDLDVWTIDQNGLVVHVTNDLDPK